MSKNIILGTAQFGMDYGITNAKGKINREEASQILDLAYSNGIKTLDTAQSYGDAEKNISNFKNSTKFEINTKINFSQEEMNSDNNLYSIKDKLFNSLRKLKRKNLNSLSIHNGWEISNQCDGLISCAKDFKKKGFINSFGASIYEDSIIPENILREFDFIQIPFSLFNQDILNNNIIDLCKKNKVDIHVRSIFCQGLVLCKPENIPNNFSEEDKLIIKEIYKLVKSKGYSLLNYACSFINSKDWISSIIIGVTSKEELQEVLASLNSSNKLEFNEINQLTSYLSKQIKDPRKWEI